MGEHIAEDWQALFGTEGPAYRRLGDAELVT